MKTLLREAAPIRASEVRQHSVEFLIVPSVFAVLWAETLPEDVLLRVMELYGIPRDQARPMLARWVSSGWMTHEEVAPDVSVFTLGGPVRPLFDKILAPELHDGWPGMFHQVIYNFDTKRQDDMADQIRYMGGLVGFADIAPGVLLGFTPMAEVAEKIESKLEAGNLLETGSLMVSESQARRIVAGTWDFEAIAAWIAEKRRALAESEESDSNLRGAAAVQRLRDLYLDRNLMLSGPGRIPDSVRPHGIGLGCMADQYAVRLDQIDAITGPVIAEAVADCAHADLVLTRADDSPQTR